MPDAPLVNLSIKSFLDRLASDAPAPGGGAAAALTAATAAALGSMACALTVDNPKHENVRPQVNRHAERLQRYREMLERLIDEDAAAYLELRAALKLDKSDPVRAERVAAAAQLAAEVPLETTAIARKVNTELRQLTSIANKYLRSDVQAGTSLAHAAMIAAAANVEANLPLIPEDRRRAIERELSSLLEPD